VENIFINNISMKNIVGEAILFDMYYAAQDPVPLTGEKREPPKVETQPVSEATPQFKNFTIKNVVCNGAAKAIFVRGLPEMSVKNIVLENMVLQANDGLDMTEGSGIALKNIQLITKNTNPVMNIHNSKDIVLNKIGFKSGAELLLNVTGEKTSGVVLKDTDASKAKKKVEFGFGAGEGSVTAK
jgi:hypothetical protein